MPSRSELRQLYDAGAPTDYGPDDRLAEGPWPYPSGADGSPAGSKCRLRTGPG
jgi:hypothetical protein